MGDVIVVVDSYGTECKICGIFCPRLFAFILTCYVSHLNTARTPTEPFITLQCSLNRFKLDLVIITNQPDSL